MLDKGVADRAPEVMRQEKKIDKLIADPAKLLAAADLLRTAMGARDFCSFLATQFTCPCAWGRRRFEVHHSGGARL